jgi:hypothetical protein
MNKLPLSPTDLVTIYKEKLTNKSYVLMIDYEGSKEVLGVEHILIYLSNTGFTAGFSSVDDELLLKYIGLDFLVDSPILTRVWANILRTKVGVPLSDKDELLLGIFSLEDIKSFISNNKETVESLERSLRSVVVAIIDNAMDEEELTGSESGLGVNVGYLLRDAIDAVMGVISKKGINKQVDTSVFNNKSKFFGGDIFKWMSDNGTLKLVASMLPKEHEVFSSGAIKQN